MKKTVYLVEKTNYYRNTAGDSFDSQHTFDRTEAIKEGFSAAEDVACYYRNEQEVWVMGYDVDLDELAAELDDNIDASTLDAESLYREACLADIVGDSSYSLLCYDHRYGVQVTDYNVDFDAVAYAMENIADDLDRYEEEGEDSPAYAKILRHAAAELVQDQQDEPVWTFTKTCDDIAASITFDAKTIGASVFVEIGYEDRYYITAYVTTDADTPFDGTYDLDQSFVQRLI